MNPEYVADGAHHTPWWWTILWAAWGAILFIIIVTADRDPTCGLLFFGTGIAMGLFGIHAIRPIEKPLIGWYHDFMFDPERDRRALELVVQRRTDSREYTRLIEAQALTAYLMVPVVCGAFHGILLGGVGGALCHFDRSVQLSASLGAVIGIGIGPVLAAFSYAMALALIVPMHVEQPIRVRLVRRMLLVMSPFLILPAGWHCLKMAFWRRGWR